MPIHGFGRVAVGPNGGAAAWGRTAGPQGVNRGGVAVGPNGGTAASTFHRDASGSQRDWTRTRPDGTTATGGYSYDRASQTLTRHRNGQSSSVQLP